MEGVSLGQHQPLIDAIDAAHEAKRDGKRPHLGASILGKKCDRAIWYAFRWATVEKFSGRMLRLFRRGHREELTIVEDLILAGCRVEKFGAGQVQIDFGCHVKGTPDGIITSGVPGAEKTAHVLEMKTHNKKSFDKLEAQGVHSAKPEHYIQMQVCMHGTGIHRALYVAVCKDDDRLYAERVYYAEDVATQALARAKRIALSPVAPDKISTDPSWWECKFCPSHGLCHRREISKEVNCRTCKNATAHPDGTFRCAIAPEEPIPEDFQQTGCDEHIFGQDFVPSNWQLLGVECFSDLNVWSDGENIIKNGNYPDRPDVYTSAELAAALETIIQQPPILSAIKEAWPDARVLGTVKKTGGKKDG